MFLLKLPRVIREKYFALLEALNYRAGLWGALTTAFTNGDAKRVALVFAAFSFSWKFLNNALRIVRNKEDKWNGLISGGVAGISIALAKPDHRTTLSQQLLVRYASSLLGHR